MVSTWKLQADRILQLSWEGAGHSLSASTLLHRSAALGEHDESAYLTPACQ